MFILELPAMRESVGLVSRTAGSITVKWRKWHNPPDRGDGPVSSYVLRYKKKGGVFWSEKLVTGLQTNITQLRENSTYVFQVIFTVWSYSHYSP